MERVPICHISKSFVSAGWMHENQVAVLDKETNQEQPSWVQPCSPGVRKMHLGHAPHKHLFMHSSNDRCWSIDSSRTFHSSKNGIKSNTSVQEKVLSSQNQELRGHRFTRVGAIDGSTSMASLPQSLW